MTSRFERSLFFPDWHSAGTTRAHEGALALRSALDAYGPFLEVPVVTADSIDDPSDASRAQTIVARSAVLRHMRQSLDLLEKTRPATLFSILGTCGAELAPVAWLNGKNAGDLAVVWLDAHGDLNTPHSSPSKRFHGMILRTLLGEGDPDLTTMVAHPLEPAQVILAGTRDLDPPEQNYIATNEIAVVLPADLEFSPDALIAAVRASGRRHIYIHLDLDVIDPVEFPNVIVPAPGGVSAAAIERTLRALTTTFDCIGLSVVEYAAGPQDLTGVVRRILETNAVSVS